MIAIEDALDKYFLTQVPDAFFSGSAEAAVIDTENFPIKKGPPALRGT